jgi:hypothetical protein
MEANFCILDAARVGREMEEAFRLNPNHDCLYTGEAKTDLGGVAPWLFRLNTEPDNFRTWVTQKGWGDAWGILIGADATFEVCSEHFRKFLEVRTPDGEECYFRFYDPRVLRAFLPSCDPQQIIEFFGPVDYFVTETDNGTGSIRFSHHNGKLVQQVLTATTKPN